jgi:hypothetical protein
MARRKSRRGLGSLGNVTATKALQTFLAAVRKATVAAQSAARASADPSAVIEYARAAKIALADAEAAAATLKAQGAFHGDYRSALRQAQSLIAEMASYEDRAARDARSYLGPDAYDRNVDGLAGYGRRRSRRRGCRC